MTPHRSLLPFAFLSASLLPVACGSSTTDAPVDSIPDASADRADAPADSPGDATGDPSTDSTIDAGLDSTASDGSLDASIPDVGPDTSVSDAGDARIVFAAATSPNGPSQIQIMHTDGSGIQVLTGTASALPDNASDQPSFSPDGQTILFSSRAYIVTDSGMVMSTSRALYTMSRDGTGITRLTSNDATLCDEHSGRFSHDGQWVAFAMVCQPEGGIGTNAVDQIYRVKSDGTSQEQLVQEGTEVGGWDVYGEMLEVPAFSGDDKQIVFTRDYGLGPTSLLAIDVDTKAVHSVAQMETMGWIYGTPVVTSGNVVYFVSGGKPQGGQPAALMSVNLDGTGEQTVAAIPVLTSADVNGTPTQFDFSLSPDETQFVLAVYESGSTSAAPSAEIGITSLALEGLNSLTSFLLAASSPSWR